jgi:B9 domain-containing protein 1
MFINYQGVFESATSAYPHSLALMYTALAEEGWKNTHGQTTGISQHAAHGDRGFVWNMPFEITYEVRSPQGWPQMAIVLYGKDYLGRSVARGYGNFHLPSAEGSHTRKVRIFEAVPPSTAATCCAYLMGYINELKTPEKVLLGT